MAELADILVIGAGIAGASAAYELAAERRVIVLEQEERPGFHATGRSAALFSETYGNATVRALSRASRPFLTAPAATASRETPLLQPARRAVRRRRGRAAAPRSAGGRRRDPAPSSALSGDEVRWRACPILRPEASVAGLYEAGAMDIDVDALHQGFLRGLRRRGGALVTDAGVDRR